jgi:hypothetical protein
MSNLNTILNKLGKIEAIEKTNLEKHEIELAITDELKRNVKFDNDNIAVLKSKMDLITTELKNLTSLYEKANKGIATTGTTYDRMVGMAKELGLPESQISNLPEVKQYENNGVALTEVLRFINKYGK